VERATQVSGLQVERVIPRGDLVQYFFSGDPHPTHPLTKVELLFDTPPYFADPRPFNSVLVDDLLSIAVNKLTIPTRFDPKDYIDLYLIVTSGRLRLEDLIPLAKEKVPGLDELTIAAHFMKVEQLPNLTEFQRGYMVNAVESRELLRFYQDWATRLFALFPPRRQA
jgi:hypothetical protein